jgi:hypothetical protein
VARIASSWRRQLTALRLTHLAYYRSTNAAAILIAAALALCAPLPASDAQSGPGNPPPTPREPTSAPLKTTRQELSLAGGARSYSIDDTTITERIGSLIYDGRRGRYRLRLDGTLVRYTAPPGSVNGTSPISIRLDRAVGSRDSVSVYGRTASSPTFLSTTETDAIGAAATSTIDLEAFWLGTPAMIGARAAGGRELGGTVVSLRAAVESEPRPSGTEPIYWRGTTIAGGATVAAGLGNIDLSLRADVRQSFADSLGGRNLFPGGGLLMVRGAASRSFLNPIDALADDADLSLSAFYSQNIGNDRNTQPNRLIQSGAFVAAAATLALPWRDEVFLPSVEFLRESSTSKGSSVLDNSTGNAYSTRMGLGALIPLTSVFDIMPDFGYAFGSVNANYMRSTTGGTGARFEQVNLSSPVRGWWVRLELTANY